MDYEWNPRKAAENLRKHNVDFADAVIALEDENALTVEDPNLVAEDPAKLWRHYIQLTEIEQAFKELKSDLSIRPIYHQKDSRIEAHIFVAFQAYCLQVTLKQRLRALASGLTPKAVLEKFSANRNETKQYFQGLSHE